MTATYECPPLENNLNMDELVIPKDISRVVLYHGTSSKFRDEILTKGLRSRNQTGNSVYDGHIASDETLVYLARKEVAEGAASLALDKYGEDRTVVAVEVDISHLVEDEDVRKIFGATGWRESLRLNGTCAHNGPVNSIKQLVVYNGDSFTDIKEVVTPNPLN